ncbi:laccase [Suillus fuscotomentosus]|uniref:laccase n=1 Tax=Suillus fuscotomentosus TaxID=1912939 RepID=A0AAD4E756_9AGAM|nr:laccase [Suillus fuscotomentosus]KAG1899689.1 laccase [Suillus fuscotomentosus]
MIQHYILLCVLTSLQSYAVTIGPVADLVIANAQISPDGFIKSAVLAGGTLPGPIITGQKGDTFKINVTNHLNDETMLTSTSIHWHGLFQRHSNQMDGAAFVTQCPISPGHSFLYEFNAGEQVGTYWYHSHYGVQYCDGLRGALIIYDPQDPYRFLYDIDDESTVITLMDWYHVPSPQVQRQVVPDSVLINGVGSYPGVQDTPYAIINVQPYKRYRFRLLNMACKPNYVFSIDDHKLIIIEADGQYVEPLIVDSIQIYAAQRYSFILETNRPVDNYWVHAVPNLGISSMAILRYAGSPDADPEIRLTPKPVALQETDLHPLYLPLPMLLQEDGATIKLNIVLAQNETNFNFLVNGVQYTSPTIPVLLQLLNGDVSTSEMAPNGSIYFLPRNRVIEISWIPDLAPARPHPFHLHGHKFAVIRSAGSSRYNYINPVLRDTVNTGFIGDYVTIRFITDNPGPWLLHCHIDWHLYSGMALVFAEASQDVAASQPLSDSSKQLCPIYYSLPQQNFSLPPSN